MASQTFWSSLMYLSSSFICGKKLKLITEQKQIEQSIFYFWIHCWTNYSNISTYVLRPGNTSHVSVNNNPDLFMSYLNFDNHFSVCLFRILQLCCIGCLFVWVVGCCPSSFFLLLQMTYIGDNTTVTACVHMNQSMHWIISSTL